MFFQWGNARFWHYTKLMGTIGKQGIGNWAWKHGLYKLQFDCSLKWKGKTFQYRF